MVLNFLINILRALLVVSMMWIVLVIILLIIDFKEYVENGKKDIDEVEQQWRNAIEYEVQNSTRQDKRIRKTKGLYGRTKPKTNKEEHRTRN